VYSFYVKFCIRLQNEASLGQFNIIRYNTFILDIKTDSITLHDYIKSNTEWS